MALLSTWAGRFRVHQYVKGSLRILPLLGALDEAALGTSRLSPRFMQVWYRDHLQKVVLATFAGTPTFTFTLLRRIGDPGVPNLGVTLAGPLVVVSLVLLLLYLDRFTHGLRPVAVGTLVARAGLRVVADTPPAPRDTSARRGAMFLDAPGRAMVVRSPASGVVQAVHIRGLVAVGRRRGCVVVVTGSPGAAREFASTPDRQGVGGRGWLSEPVVAPDGSPG